MKLYSFILSILVLLFFAFGNSSQQLEKFVEHTERHCANYTDKDWDKSIEEYEKLKAKFEASKDKLSDEDKKAAMKAMGRYHGLLIRKGIKQGIDILKEFSRHIPEYLEGLTEGLKKEEDKSAKP